MTHVTCMLTAKNRDQLRNPKLGNRVWATFTLCSLFLFHDNVEDRRCVLTPAVSSGSSTGVELFLTVSPPLT